MVFEDILLGRIFELMGGMRNSYKIIVWKTWRAEEIRETREQMNISKQCEVMLTGYVPLVGLC